jgi:hypothetical protein
MKVNSSEKQAADELKQALCKWLAHGASDPAPLKVHMLALAVRMLIDTIDGMIEDDA